MSLGDEFVNLLASIHSNVSFKQTFWSFERTFNSTLMASFFVNDRHKKGNRIIVSVVGLNLALSQLILECTIYITNRCEP